MERYKKNDSNCGTYARSNYRPSNCRRRNCYFGELLPEQWSPEELSFGNYLLLGQSSLWSIYGRSNCRWSNLGSNFHRSNCHPIRSICRWSNNRRSIYRRSNYRRSYSRRSKFRRSNCRRSICRGAFVAEQLSPSAEQIMIGSIVAEHNVGSQKTHIYAHFSNELNSKLTNCILFDFTYDIHDKGHYFSFYIV